jgi:hypothetical protein
MLFVMKWVWGKELPDAHSAGIMAEKMPDGKA